MNEPTNWMPGVYVLGAAVLAAIAFVIQTLRKGSSTAAAGPRATELDVRYGNALEQLKELKADQHHLEPQAYEAQRAELEQKAAAMLRARAKGGPAATAASPPRAASKGLLSRHPEWKGALWGGGVMAFIGLLAITLMREEKPKMDSKPSGPRAAAPAAPAAEDDELAQAMEHVREHPEDAETASALGHELIRRQDWDQARTVTDRALGAEPFHVENRIHRAVLKSVAGDRVTAMAELQRLVDTYVDAQEALLFLASMQHDAGDTGRALEALERYVSSTPPAEQSPQIWQAIAQFRRQLGRAP